MALRTDGSRGELDGRCVSEYSIGGLIPPPLSSLSCEYGIVDFPAVCAVPQRKEN